MPLMGTVAANDVSTVRAATVGIAVGAVISDATVAAMARRASNLMARLQRSSGSCETIGVAD